MITAIAILSVILYVEIYLVIVGVVYAYTVRYLDDWYTPEIPAAFAAAFWPVALPIFVGIYAARTPRRLTQKREKDRVARQVRIRELEMSELDCEVTVLFGDQP